MVLLNCEVTSEDKSCDLDLLICWRKCTHTSQEIKYSLYFIVKTESCGAWVCWHRYLEPKSFVSCYFSWMMCPQKTTCCKILYYPLGIVTDGSPTVLSPTFFLTDVKELPQFFSSSVSALRSCLLLSFSILQKFLSLPGPCLESSFYHKHPWGLLHAISHVTHSSNILFLEQRMWLSGRMFF